MEDQIIVALDCETYLIGPGQVAPKVVCISLAVAETGEIVLFGNGEKALEKAVKQILLNPDIIIVGHNIKFDLGCLYYSYPDLQSLIWKALINQRITCTQIRERLLNLSSHGNLDYYISPDGASKKIEYSLANLLYYYTGKDRRKEKEDPKGWRLRYKELDGKSADDYPIEAKDYALKDASNTLELYTLQKDREENSEGGPCSTKTQFFQTACDFALYLMTIRGIKTDQTAVQKLQNMIDIELSYDKLDLLIKSGILAPPKPGRPHKRNPNKLTKSQPEKINTKALKEIITTVCEENDVDIKLTRTGEIRADKDVLSILSELNPILAQYQHRQNLNKIKTTEIPRLNAGLVHPNFQVLERSGRTASYAGKKPLYPAFNCQNVDYRVRHCFVPRDGFVFCAVDYSAIELVSLAQKCYTILGYSKLRDLINNGKDPHAFLGAYLAFNLNEDFANLFYQEHGIDESEENIYDLFMKFKQSNDIEDRAFFKHWRTFAKPTGLGYPGGLGPKKFVSYAKATFGIDVTQDQAEAMRTIWHKVFPEMAEYFNYITKNMTDPKDPNSYLVMSPLGMYRAGASYCAACNGNALQTPTAEGAKGAVFEVSRQCYDSSLNSILTGCYPIAFIHDEIILEIPEDDLMHVRAAAISKIMIDSMKNIMQDTKVEAEAVLMRFWSKEAEAVYDENGRLQIWQP